MYPSRWTPASADSPWNSWDRGSYVHFQEARTGGRVHCTPKTRCYAAALAVRDYARKESAKTTMALTKDGGLSWDARIITESPLPLRATTKILLIAGVLPGGTTRPHY